MHSMRMVISNNMTKPKYQNYRVCYDNWDCTKANKLYQVHKYCDCEGCKQRNAMRREPSNWVACTTKDISKVDAMAEFIKSWTCEDGSKKLEPVFLRFEDGDKE